MQYLLFHLYYHSLLNDLESLKTVFAHSAHGSAEGLPKAPHKESPTASNGN